MSPRIKVLEISGYPPPHGGWSMRTEQLKKRLDAEGHDCVVLNIGESRRIPSPHYETAENAWVYVRKAWQYCRRGYLVHTHANGEAPKGILLAIIAEVLARLVGVGSVLTLHAGTNQVFFPRENAPRWTPVFRLLFGLPRSIICNSDAVKQKIVEYGIAADKVVPIPAFSRQYVDFTPVSLPTDVERHFQNYPRTLFSYLAMRSTFYPHVLLKAFADVSKTDPELGLFVCGVASHAEGAVAEDFQSLTRELGLQDRLCEVGYLTHDQFLTAMTRSLAYVRTPPSDGVCSSVLEALTLGVTVVACDNGTRPDSVFLFPAEDPIALAQAIRRVLAAARPSSARPVNAADIPDTVRLEIDLLVAAAGGAAVRETVAA